MACATPGCHYTLHSTMFLLIQKRIANGIKKYIALHSTMFLLIQPWHHRKPRHHRNFTFHYVSINTGNRRNPYVAKKTNFTFHYVSINT